MEPNDLESIHTQRAGGSAVGRIDAATMLQASRNDPEMSIPKRPAFLPGGVLHTVDDGLVVDGGAARQVLNGSAATSLVPKIIDVLDGTKTIPEIAIQLDVPPIRIEAAVALMAACGLIVPSLDSPDHVDSSVVDTLARHLDTTKRWSSAKEAYRSASAQPAYIIDNGLLSNLVAESLRSCGDRVFLVDNPLEADQSGYLIAIGADVNTLRQAKKHVDSGNGVVKACGFHDDRIWVAPTSTSSGQAACTDCLISALRETQLLGTEVGSSPGIRLAAALLALEIFHERLGIGRPLASNSLLIHDLSVGQSLQLMVPRTPGCTACGIPGKRMDQPWPFVYDQAAVFPPRNQVAMKGHQMHYKPSNLALQWARREFRQSTHHRFSASVDWQHPTDSRSKLGALLRYAFGLREIEGISQVQRFSPTGGNLGSPEGVVIVRHVDNVAPGAYYYLPFEDRCALLGEVSDKSLLNAIDVVDFEAIIVLTASLSRVEKKYHSLALRICFLDAGAAVSQLRHTAGALDFQISLIEQWDDRSLKNSLHLNEDHPIMAVVGINGLKGIVKE